MISELEKKALELNLLKIDTEIKLFRDIYSQNNDLN